MKYPTVLLLEDEPAIAEHIRWVLHDFDCRVVAAADGREALLHCTEHRPDFAVLNFHQKEATDGMALARLLRGICPIKVFFVTGARRADLAASPDFDAAHPVLFKPFTRRQLRRAFEGLLP